MRYNNITALAEEKEGWKAYGKADKAQQGKQKL